MPTPLSLPVTWSTPLPPVEARRVPGRGTPAMIGAVAAVVGIAAERCRATGDLAALRDAIDSALEAAAADGAG
jgi:hypothetical protein